MENTETRNDLNMDTGISHEIAQAKRSESNNKLLILIVILALVIIAGAIVIVYFHGNSYESKMARFEKTATKFKETLGPNERIIAERIDSIAQKVYYLIPNKEENGNIKNIKVHDYATNETRFILPVSEKIEDYEFCNIEFRDSKQIKDRLFIIVNSSCMWRLGATGIFYIDIRDNSLHYVESCDDASFRGNSEIVITKFYYLGEDEYGGEETKSEEYTLSTSLSDEGYADNRWEQKRKEERLAEEWRTRDIERVIKFDYTVQQHKPVIDHISTIRAVGADSRFVESYVITVPKNKVWVFKRFSYSGYYLPPELHYYVPNGYGNNLVNNAEVFYPGQYVFYVFDYSNHLSGHRTATVKFSEEMY